MSSNNNNNCNLVRMIAAFLVFFSHTISTFGYKLPHLIKTDEIVGIDLGALGVTIFFVISGFLCTQSLERNTIRKFYLNRIIRIYPGLIANLLITYFLLLPLIDKKASEYFILLAEKVPAILQFITFGNSEALEIYKNPPLWTLPYEVLCYICLGIFGLLALFKKIPIKITIPISTIFYLLLFYSMIFYPYADSDIIYHTKIAYLHIATFFLGSCAYLYRNHMALKWEIALICIATVTIISVFDIYLYQLYFLAVSYLALYAAFGIKPIMKFFQKNDLSYGWYIYASLVQIIISNGFSIFHAPVEITYFILYFALCFFFTFLFSWFSWKIIEKPALKLKSRFK